MKSFQYLWLSVLMGIWVGPGCRPERNIVDPEGEGGGGGASSGGSENVGGDGGAENPVVVGPVCERDADCENADEDHCRVSCDDVDGENRCVTTAVDEDDDGHGTAECAAVPGDDCDDADELSFGGGAALIKAGEPAGGTYIHFTSEGDAYLFSVLPASGEYGQVTVQPIDERGEVFGAVTTYSGSEGSEVRAGGVAVAEKDAPGTIGLVWPRFVPGNATYRGSAFAEVSLSANSSLGSNVVSSTYYSACDAMDVGWTGSAWTAIDCTSYVTTTFQLSDGVSDAVMPATTFTSGRPHSSVLVGSTRLVVGLNQHSHMNDAYDPSLLIRRFPTTGTLQNHLTPDRVLIGAAHATDIAPTFAIGAHPEGAVVVYGDAATGVPLTVRVVDETAQTVGTERPVDSDLTPLDVGYVASRGWTLLLGQRIVAGRYQLVLQGFDEDLEPAFEELTLGESMQYGITLVRLSHYGVRVAVGYYDQNAPGMRVQSFRINSCVE